MDIPKIRLKGIKDTSFSEAFGVLEECKAEPAKGKAVCMISGSRFVFFALGGEPPCCYRFGV